MRFFLAIVTVVVWMALAGAARADVADGIKAVVHDSIVTYQQVDNETLPLVDDLRRDYRNDRPGFEKKINEVLDETTEQLIERRLILHEFETAGYSLPESVIEDYVQKTIRERYGDRATLTKTLQAEGMTFEKFRKRIRDQFIITQMGYKNVSEATVISPHKIEMYYVEHTNEFRVQEQVKLRMIVLTNSVSGDSTQARELANEILGKIKEGASFPEMASIYSQGSQRGQGGDWGWVDKLNADGAPVLRRELFETAFSLKPGEKSGVIETPDACYLMLVEDRRPEHIKPLNEVRDEIEKTLLSQERTRLQKQWIGRLKKKTFVRYF